MPPVDPSILEKLRKLIDHANSAKEIGSLKEAEAFATKIQELLSKHKLSMTDVDAKVEEAAGVGQSDVPLMGKKGEKNALLDKPTVIQWLWTIAHATAKCNDCSVLVSPKYKNVPFWDAQKRIAKLKKELASLKKIALNLGIDTTNNAGINALEMEIKLLNRGLEAVGMNTYLFVGVDADRAVAVELYKYFSALCWEFAIKESAKHKEAFKQTIASQEEGNLSRRTHQFRHSYCQGFADAISKRLFEQRAAMLAQAAAATNTCTAMMVVDRRALMVQDWMGKNSSKDKVSDMYKAGGNDALAYVMGQAAGNAVALTGKAIQ